jgi:class 3 adenylate cyclase/pimeloyl-ACP methyl ester carboxylesterase
MSSAPPVQYARTPRGDIAYRIFGRGEIDAIWLQGMGRTVELVDDLPAMAEMLERMGRFLRLVIFDRRGTGISHPLPSGDPPSWEDWSEDIKSILDGLGIRTAALIAERDAGGAAIAFAATNPDRVRALVLGNTSARPRYAPGYPCGLSPERVDFLARMFRDDWGTERFGAVLTPSLAGDRAFMAWFSRMQRIAYAPAVAHAEFLYSFDMDTRSLLASVHCPTLVIQRRHYPLMSVEHSSYIAERIAGARLEIIPGDSTAVFLPNDPQVLALLEEFLTGARSQSADDRILATVLFTDIAGATECAAQLGDGRWKDLLRQHHEIVRTELSRFRGREVDNAGDGFLAQFDGPARALRCAASIRQQLRERLQLEVRAGVHIGECERLGDKLSGLAVHIGARIQGAARPGEVLVSQTVKDLVVGAGLTFREAGVHELKGVPERWPLYALT